MALGYAGASHATEFRCYSKRISILAFQSSSILLFCYFQHTEYNHSNCKIPEEDTRLLDTRFSHG